MKNILPRKERRSSADKVKKRRYKAVRLHSWLIKQGVKKGDAVREVACDFLINIRTLYRWLSSYRTGGKRNLSPFISYRRPPVKTPSHIIEMILFLHETYHYGGQKIATELIVTKIYSISPQAVYLLIKRFSRKKKKDLSVLSEKIKIYSFRKMFV